MSPKRTRRIEMAGRKLKCIRGANAAYEVDSNNKKVEYRSVSERLIALGCPAEIVISLAEKRGAERRSLPRTVTKALQAATTEELAWRRSVDRLLRSLEAVMAEQRKKTSDRYKAFLAALEKSDNERKENRKKLEPVLKNIKAQRGF
jgi:hypothetical protein